MRGLFQRTRAVWRRLWRSRQLDADMQEEIRFHLQQEADRLARAHGLSPHEARRQACVNFGGVEKFKEEGREAHGLAWLNGVSLDARLGARMLVKHRWLTLVGGVAMTVAIGTGATAFDVINALLQPALPFPQGDRAVAVRYVAAKVGGPDPHVLHVFTAWRDRLTTLEQAGAFRSVRHNLVAPNAAPEPVEVAEITASAFDLAQTPPLLGRYLLRADEQPSAPPVVVIGQMPWRLRFHADPNIVGRTMQLGGTVHTIVGVMPDGFGFPIDDQFWIPLRLDPLQFQAWQGPGLELFARLKAGVTAAQAEAELASAARNILDAYPDGRDGVRPVVLPYTRAHLDVGDPGFAWLLRVAQILVSALVFVVAINLAILLYARTVTRMGEIAVRTALGASRRRILSQLFVEALALTGLGAVAGLACSAAGLRYVEWLARANGGLPFWIHYTLSPSSVLYGIALAVIAAVIMGVLPGLKATGARLSPTLQELTGRTATRLGSLWTTLIVGQVAVAVAILPAAAYIAWHVVATELHGPAVAIDRLLVANMNLDDEVKAPPRELVRQRLLTLIGRLRAEPGVTDVTFSSALPGLGPDRRVEFDDEAHRRAAGTPEIAAFTIDVDLIRIYGARMLAGRDFTARDTAASSAVIVNHTFAVDVLGGTPQSALGARFRYLDRPEWFDVVGVVEDFPGFPRSPGSETEPTLYRPGGPGDFYPPVLSVRFAGPVPAGIAERLRAIGADIDPALQVRRVLPLSSLYDELRSVWRMIAWGAAVVTITVLLLSAAGMHALLSFTIAQRTREIGIRSALGAEPRQLLVGVFGRAMRQLSIGLAVGSLMAIGLFSTAGIGLVRGAMLLLTVAVLVAIVGACAAIGPARRSLRLPTVDALRVEG